MFSIKDITSGLYLTEERRGACQFGSENERLIFNDETDARNVLEYLNDTRENCFILLDDEIIPLF